MQNGNYIQIRYFIVVNNTNPLLAFVRPMIEPRIVYLFEYQ